METTGILLWASLHSQGVIFSPPRWAEGQETLGSCWSFTSGSCPPAKNIDGASQNVQRVKLGRGLPGREVGKCCPARVLSKLAFEPFWSNET